MSFEFIQTVNKMELLFWIFAIFGSVFLVLRVLLMLLGVFGDIVPHDVSHEDPSGFETHSHDDAGSDSAFKIFSITSITGFFMMFGWIGLAALKEYKLSPALCILAATIAGLFAMYVTGLLMHLSMKLSSPGTQFRISETLGKHASVYIQIPSAERGKIQITHDGSTRILEAISEDKKDIPSFKNVTIVRVIDSKTVSVKED